VVTAASAGLGAGLGPVIMGGVLSAHGWRAVFWLTGALCLLALVLVLASTRGASTRFPARFDLPGAVVLAAALTVLLLGITNGAGWGWTSPRIVALVAGAGAMAAWWVRWERSRLEPLVDLAVSTSRPVLIAHLGGVMVGCATFAQFISSFTLVSLPVGHGLGRSLAVAGLVRVPFPLSVIHHEVMVCPTPLPGGPNHEQRHRRPLQDHRHRHPSRRAA
jgi:MFS family permease